MTEVVEQRLDLLKQWLQQVIPETIQDIQTASADASFRRYYRVYLQDKTYIAMDAPPQREDIRPFIRIAERFLSIGLQVPEIFRQDLDQGFLLISDLGDEIYLNHLNAGNATRLYSDAIQALIVLQRNSLSEPHFLPDYDVNLLRNELELFREWFLSKHLQIKLTEAQNSALNQVFDELIQSALSQPRVWVHRDYHSRNLMLLPQHNPGILDFQDAVLGPISYDLVSLLRDCYIAWPKKQVREWVGLYRQQATATGLPVAGDEQEFMRWFDLMGIQRHLKAIGIFARLNHRDGKSAYLGDIPRTMAYVVEASADYRNIQPLFDLLQQWDLAAP